MDEHWQSTRTMEEMFIAALRLDGSTQPRTTVFSKTSKTTLHAPGRASLSLLPSGPGEIQEIPSHEGSRSF